MSDANGDSLKSIEAGYRHWVEYSAAMAQAGDPLPADFHYIYGYTDIMLRTIAQLRVAIARQLELPPDAVKVVMEQNLSGVLAISGTDVSPPDDWHANMDPELRKDMISSVVLRFFDLARDLAKTRLESYMRIRTSLLPVT